jgi:hypothetical protein
VILERLINLSHPERFNSDRDNNPESDISVREKFEFKSNEISEVSPDKYISVRESQKLTSNSDSAVSPVSAIFLKDLHPSRFNEVSEARSERAVMSVRD